MAPKSAEAISERNAALLAIYLKCFKTKPEVDWEKVAKLGKFKDVRSARGSVDYLLKKVIPNKDNEGDGTVADPSSPVAEKTTARKRKSDVDENGEGSAKKKEATPSKGKKAEAANDNGKGGNIKDNEEGGGLKGEDGDDDDDF